MRWPALALALLLAACGDGTSPGAQPSPAPSASRVLTGDTKTVGDAVRATLAACPCRVTMRISGYGDDLRISGDFAGPWNPKSGGATLRDKKDGTQVRIVAGETYVSVPKDTQATVGAEWFQLDFARVPAKDAPFAPFALADPALLFAIAEHVSVATRLQAVGTSVLYDAEFDVAAAATALGGAKGDLLRRIVTTPSLYEKIKVDAKGRVQSFSLISTGPDDVAGDMGVYMDVVAVNVRDPLAPAPTSGVRRIDAATVP